MTIPAGLNVPDRLWQGLFVFTSPSLLSLCYFSLFSTFLSGLFVSSSAPLSLCPMSSSSSFFLSLIYFCLHLLQFSAPSAGLNLFHSNLFFFGFDRVRFPEREEKTNFDCCVFFFSFTITEFKKKHETKQNRTEPEEGAFGIRIGMNWIRSSSFTESQLTEIVLIAN